MKSRALPAWVVVVGVVSTLLPSIARADPAGDAKDLFAHGRELRVGGDCAGALPVFRKAYELYPAGLGSLRNIAECEESLGHFATARRAWLDLKRVLLASNDRKYEGWQQDADHAATRLAPKLATVTVDVYAVTPSGQTVSGKDLEVTLNGEVLAPSLVGTQLERDPGKYVLRATGPGVSAPQEQAIDLAPGDVKRATLRVVVAPMPQPLSPAPLPPRAAKADPLAARRTTAWVAIGVGAAGLVGAGVSLAVYGLALGDLNNKCPGYQGCDRSLQPTADRGHTAAMLVNVFGGVAIVGLAGGVGLLVASLPPSTHTAVMLSPTGISAFGRF